MTTSAPVKPALSLGQTSEAYRKALDAFFPDEATCGSPAAMEALFKAQEDLAAAQGICVTPEALINNPPFISTYSPVDLNPVQKDALVREVLDRAADCTETQKNYELACAKVGEYQRKYERLASAVRGLLADDALFPEDALLNDHLDALRAALADKIAVPADTDFTADELAEARKLAAT
jgi:hypothetical protein